MTSGPKVLFVVGKGRSGSTLLDRLLGQLDGFFSIGELWWVDPWGFAEHYLCGCGRPARTCPIWSEVLADAFDGRAPTDADVARWRREVISWRRLPRLLVRRDATGWDALERWTDACSRVYAATARVTGARVIVDSFKWPAHPGLLGLVGGIDPHAVHLVRDPRAVTYSWQRSKTYADRTEETEMPRYGAGYSALSWLARNAGAELARRRVDASRWLTVRYEDFVVRPADTIRNVAAMVSEPADPPFEDGDEIELSEHHMLGGNPSGRQDGLLRLTPDVEWETELPRRDRLVTTLVTLPLLRRYGYRPRARAQATITTGRDPGS